MKIIARFAGYLGVNPSVIAHHNLRRRKLRVHHKIKLLSTLSGFVQILLEILAWSLSHAVEFCLGLIKVSHMALHARVAISYLTDIAVLFGTLYFAVLFGVWNNY